eukprot:958277_1
MMPASTLLAHGFAICIHYVVIQAFVSFPSIDEALGFYGVYHRDPSNQLIHFFGVPLIIWSLLVGFSHVDLPLVSIPINIPGVAKHNATYATLLSVIYVLAYTYLDTFGGFLYTPFAYALYMSAVSMKLKYEEDIQSIKTKNANAKPSTSSSSSGTGRLMKMAVAAHFLGWGVQIGPGHAYFEGATPAALKSFGGALSAAPLFAYYEGLWFLGLNTKLQQRTQELVDQYTVDLCRNGENMRVCAEYDLN